MKRVQVAKEITRMKRKDRIIEYVLDSICLLKPRLRTDYIFFYTWKWKHISIARVFCLLNQTTLCFPSLQMETYNLVSGELFYGLCCD